MFFIFLSQTAGCRSWWEYFAAYNFFTNFEFIDLLFIHQCIISYADYDYVIFIKILPVEPEKADMLINISLN